MDNMHAIFMTEANELINELEKSLLLLDNEMENKEGIASVFRSMHTLKGSSGMFGYENVSHLTHMLETLYDQIRNNDRKLTKDILSITLKATDHLKKILSDFNLTDESVRKTHQELIDEINRVLDNKKLPEVDGVQNEPVAKTENIQNRNESTYYIHFIPQHDILKNGTNTLYLFDEIYQMGQCVTLPYFLNLPEFTEIIPEFSYTCFESVIATSCTIEELREVFIFVESNSDLTIKKIANLNILKESGAFEKLEKLQTWTGPVGEKRIISTLIDSKANITSERKHHKTENIKSISNVRVSSTRLDELMNLVSELVTTQAGLSLLAENSEISELKTIAENIEKITRRLRDNAFTMSLVPIETLVVRYQRLVRDLSIELKKDVIFITEGTETEIEKSIIEKLTDTFLHLLRNSLDHGIESEDVRIRNGKPKQGTILLKSYYRGSNVIIEINDDGAGIDPEKIRISAEEKGIIQPNANLSRKELLNLIFFPGFSTAQTITDISGRGVGMDVVKRKISEINGEIEVDSVLNAGTKVTIKLPPSLSIMDGLLVQISDTRFIIPLSSVDQIYGISYAQIKNSYNNLIILSGENIPYFNLRDEYGYDSDFNEKTTLQVVVVKYIDKRIALVIDKVIGEHQAVLKPLGKMFRVQESISGASILGDGSIALVIDTNKFIETYSRQEALTI